MTLLISKWRALHWVALYMYTVRTCLFLEWERRGHVRPTLPGLDQVFVVFTNCIEHFLFFGCSASHRGSWHWWMLRWGLGIIGGVGGVCVLGVGEGGKGDACTCTCMCGGGRGMHVCVCVRGDKGKGGGLKQERNTCKKKGSIRE